MHICRHIHFYVTAKGRETSGRSTITSLAPTTKSVHNIPSLSELFNAMDHAVLSYKVLGFLLLGNPFQGELDQDFIVLSTVCR